LNQFEQSASIMHNSLSNGNTNIMKVWRRQPGAKMVFFLKKNAILVKISRVDRTLIHNSVLFDAMYNRSTCSENVLYCIRFLWRNIRLSTNWLASCKDIANQNCLCHLCAPMCTTSFTCSQPHIAFFFPCG